MRLDAYTRPLAYPIFLTVCNTMCTLCDARKVRKENYSLFANPFGFSGIRLSSSFSRYVHHQLTYPLFLHIPLHCYVLLRLPKRTPIPTFSSKQIAEDRHSYRVSDECQYSLNPHIFLRVTAYTIDRPQERVKEVQVRFENRCRRRG